MSIQILNSSFNQIRIKDVFKWRFVTNIDTIFTQICQYKCFQVNLKRAILQNKPNKIQRVRLINSNWFNKWKKISCYEAIKDELDLGISIQQN